MWEKWNRGKTDIVEHFCIDKAVTANPYYRIKKQ